MTISDEMVERALQTYEGALLKLHSNHYANAEPVSVSEIRSAALRAALTAALQGSVVVPAELTEDMRYATWKAQALHVGATELEAIQMANRRMTPEQRAMDQAAYAAMLAVAASVSRHERDTATEGM